MLKVLQRTTRYISSTLDEFGLSEERERYLRCFACDQLTFPQEERPGYSNRLLYFCVIFNDRVESSYYIHLWVESIGLRVSTKWVNRKSLMRDPHS